MEIFMTCGIFKQHVLLFLCFIGALVAKAEGVIHCAKCDSQDNPSCEKLAPPPKRCYSGASNVKQYCMTVKHYSSDGSLLRFVRDCTTSNVGERCTENTDPSSSSSTGDNQLTPIKVCYSTCDTDGCNAANSLVKISISFLAAASFVSIMLKSL